MDTKCILFDIDGLMVDSEKLTFTLIREILREHGFDLSLDFYRKTIGRNQKIGAQLFTDAFPGVMKRLSGKAAWSPNPASLNFWMN